MIWHSTILHRRQNLQGPPYGIQGQRSNLTQQSGSHLQIQLCHRLECQPWVHRRILSEPSLTGSQSIWKTLPTISMTKKTSQVMILPSDHHLHYSGERGASLHSIWLKKLWYIRVNKPSLNKNIGKYRLPHLWDEVLNNIFEQKSK